MASNSTKMLYAILQQIEGDLKAYGPLDQPKTIYSAQSSSNYLVAAVATIIDRIADGASANEVYKEVNQFLIDKV